MIRCTQYGRQKTMKGRLQDGKDTANTSGFSSSGFSMGLCVLGSLLSQGRHKRQTQRHFDYHRRPGLWRGGFSRQYDDPNAKYEPTMVAKRSSDELPRRSNMRPDTLGPDVRPLLQSYGHLAYHHGTVLDGSSGSDAGPRYSRPMAIGTGMFGKWHLGDSYPLRPRRPGLRLRRSARRRGALDRDPTTGGMITSTIHTGETACRRSSRVIARTCGSVRVFDSSSKIAAGPSSAICQPTPPHGPYQRSIRNTLSPYLDKGVPESDGQVLRDDREHRRESGTDFAGDSTRLG